MLRHWDVDTPHLGVSVIPTHLTVHGDEFLVTRATAEELVDSWADTDLDIHTMRVVDTANERAALRFLAHEVVHVALHNSGVEEYMDTKLEEATCWAIGSAMVDFIRENPAFVDAVRGAYK